MKHLISPNFSHDKLETPLFKEVVDVFEDRMRYWLIGPAKKLLTIRHGEVGAVALAMNYIEGIEIYMSGSDSKGKSEEFFRRGYKKIFAVVSGSDYIQDAIASGLYKMLRCGFAHDGMFRSGIYFSTVRKEAILIAWPKKNGRFDPDGKLESAIINPKGFVRCIELHLDSYLHRLVVAAVLANRKPVKTRREQGRMPTKQFGLTQWLPILTHGGLNHVKRGFFAKRGSVISFEVFARCFGYFGDEGDGFCSASQAQTPRSRKAH